MIPERLALHTFALMRIVFGLMYMSYGLLKLGLLGSPAVELASLLGAAAVIEAFIGPLIVMGLWMRPLAFIASGEMAAAYFIAHQPHGTWPVQNQGIPAVLFCFAFLYIAARGAGIWSLDYARTRRKAKTSP
jgi:putative oxidoreductase